MRDTKKIRQIVDVAQSYKENKKIEAELALKRALLNFSVEVVYFKMESGLLSNIILKVTNNQFRRLPKDFSFLKGSHFSILEFMNRVKFGDHVPSGDSFESVKAWSEDLYYVLERWVLKYGEGLMVLVGDKKDPLNHKHMNLVISEMKRYGWKGKLVIKLGLSLLGAGFWLIFAELLGGLDSNPFKKNVSETLDRIQRTASSQASWSILSSGVSQARVEAHILRLTVNQLVRSLENSKLKEEIYKHVGDNLQSLPAHLSKLERSLDRTNYALITMGSDWYRQRLVHEDREMVDMAAKFNPMPVPSTMKRSMGKKAGLKEVWSHIFNDTESLVSSLEKLETAPDYVKKKLEGKLREKLEEHKKYMLKKAQDSLSSELKKYNLELGRFSAVPKIKNNITIKDPNKIIGENSRRHYTLTNIIELLKTKSAKEEVLKTEENFYKDLLYTLEEWMFFYGSRVQRLIEECPVDYDKSKTTISKNVARLLNIGIKKARIFIESFFEFLDPSVIGLLATLILVSDKMEQSIFISLMTTWFVSFLVVGWHKSRTQWKRLVRL